MIATFTSFGSRASLALAFSARNAANAWPYWSEWICARNTYWRFWSLNTEVAIAVVIQRIFFCASTLAASGTACALAYTPSTIFDLLLVDQPFDLVDGGVRLALRVGIDGLDLVFAGDPATLVDDVDGDLRADRAGDRACRRERARKVVDDADPDRRVLGANELAAEAERGDGRRRVPEKRSARRYRFHGSSL